ncbi:MAG: isoleucine--tRNA ligase [Rickettsiales bacterium]|nr:isoleucine--tRNA ligase [Rickettsiales bacterium]
MTYPKTDPKADFPKLERDVLNYWAANDIFHKTLERTKNGKPFTFFDGPPFANGVPHWGHIGVGAMKDMVFRYKTMNDMYVLRELGWDCHGLPAEQSVEKRRNKLAKDIVADDGLPAFCDYCRADVLQYTDDFVKNYERVGRWVETGKDFGYATMDKNYMESVLWALKQLYDKGLLYKDFLVNAVDWKLGSILSNSEAALEYVDVVDDAVTVWFELGDGRRVLAWTTTPWTLPANYALAVNPKMKYLEMRDSDGAVYVIAESRLKSYERQFAAAEKIGEITGADLVGLRYVPLFDYYADRQSGNPVLHTVISADYVSDSDGTGIVHIAPAFGQEDFWAIKNIDPYLPIILNVDEYGNFDQTVRDWAGMNVFEANPKIIAHLKSNGRLVSREQYKHSYPFSYRTHEKLIYRATDSWYVNVPKIRERLIENTKLTKWYSAGERFMRWIEGARPWAISRNRFWGTPLPIWERDGEYKIFGSIAELEEFFGVRINDLHRPTLDALEKDGWKRIPDVLDCWFESGSMPFASIHYPFENADRFEATFPADYIIEGPDQTRGWFYALMVLATALFDQPAFKTVSVNGLILGADGRKMSKSLGNYTDPMPLMDKCGADAVRLYILGSTFMKCEPISLDKDGKVLGDVIRNILTPLWNAHHFFTLYANAGRVTANSEPGTDILDRYIVAELENLAETVRGALDEYAPDRAADAFAKFLDILNNWYIRLGRDRFWREEQGAFDTLHFVLTEFCKLLAPLAPFASDYIYRNLTGDESVHLQKYPHYTENESGAALRAQMRRVQAIVSVGKQLREGAKLRNRLPLRAITIAQSAERTAQSADFENIIKDELNVKEVNYLPDISSVADSFVYLITPKIGARLGGALKDIIPAVKNGAYEIRGDKLNAAGQTLNADEFESRLTVRDGVTGAALPDNTAVVVLDTELDSEQIAEGLANDALRFIQDTRKAVGLDVSDRITLEYSAAPALADALEAHRARIMAETLTVEMSRGQGEHATEIEGYSLAVTIKKA